MRAPILPIFERVKVDGRPKRARAQIGVAQLACDGAVTVKFDIWPSDLEQTNLGDLFTFYRYFRKAPHGLQGVA